MAREAVADESAKARHAKLGNRLGGSACVCHGRSGDAVVSGELVICGADVA